MECVYETSGHCYLNEIATDLGVGFGPRLKSLDLVADTRSEQKQNKKKNIVSINFCVSNLFEQLMDLL